MISVLPVKDADRLSELYLISGEELYETSEAVAAEDGGELLGYCLFDINDERIAVGTISPESDVMLADGLLRSALHVALTRQIIVAEYTDKAPEKLLRRLDFIKNDGNRSLRIEKLFLSCKNCGEE